MTTQDERYNGWATRETWAFNLWDDRNYDEDAEEALKKAASERDDDDDDATVKRVAASHLAEYIKDDMQSQMDELLESLGSASIWHDLLGGAFARIDFLEIAEHYINDLDMPETEEEE